MRIHREARLVHRVVRRTAATRPLARVYGVIQPPLDRLVYRLSGGATTASSWLAGVEIAMLTTTGARTGRPRTLPVLALSDGDDAIVIASNFGRHRNPSWYHNLRADPRATLVTNGVSRSVVARETEGAERERDYRRGEEVFRGFDHYRRWATRQIPVLRLEPPPGPSARPAPQDREPAAASGFSWISRSHGVARSGARCG
jgi:deazaflavin-dependent oxidoreductase (nitroreductase family)